MIAEKLQLKPGMRVLDIGCGWAAYPSLWHHNMALAWWA